LQEINWLVGAFMPPRHPNGEKLSDPASVALFAGNRNVALHFFSICNFYDGSLLSFNPYL